MKPLFKLFALLIPAYLAITIYGLLARSASDNELALFSAENWRAAVPDLMIYFGIGLLVAGVAGFAAYEEYREERDKRESSIAEATEVPTRDQEESS